MAPNKFPQCSGCINKLYDPFQCTDCVNASNFEAPEPSEQDDDGYSDNMTISEFKQYWKDRS